MVVGGDFSATGLARPICIEVAENPVFLSLASSYSVLHLRPVSMRTVLLLIPLLEDAGGAGGIQV
jgi:hypothetical protein